MRNKHSNMDFLAIQKPFTNKDFYYIYELNVNNVRWVVVKWLRHTEKDDIRSVSEKKKNLTVQCKWKGITNRRWPQQLPQQLARPEEDGTGEGLPEGGRSLQSCGPKGGGLGTLQWRWTRWTSTNSRTSSGDLGRGAQSVAAYPTHPRPTATVIASAGSSGPRFWPARTGRSTRSPSAGGTRRGRSVGTCSPFRHTQVPEGRLGLSCSLLKQRI